MFPELDRAAWFRIEEARMKILRGQAVFLDVFLAAIVNGYVIAQNIIKPPVVGRRQNRSSP